MIVTLAPLSPGSSASCRHRDGFCIQRRSVRSMTVGIGLSGPNAMERWLSRHPSLHRFLSTNGVLPSSNGGPKAGIPIVCGVEQCQDIADCVHVRAPYSSLQPGGEPAV